MKSIYLASLILPLFISCNDRSEQYLNDKALIIMEEYTSPNQKNKILVYQFDNGGLGYSRVFWAILPVPFDEKEGLNNYIIPDGYKAVGWSDKNELILEKWEPYYYKDKEVNLVSGNKWNNISIIIKPVSLNESTQP